MIASKKSWAFFVFLGFLNLAKADESIPYLAVGTAKVKKSSFVIQPIQTKAEPAKTASREYGDTLEQDLRFTDQFEIIPPTAAAIRTDPMEYTLEQKFDSEEANFHVEVILKQNGESAPVLAKKWVFSRSKSKAIAHQVADAIIERITGLPGIFNTRIAMVCEQQEKKELYVMNFDGSGVQQISKHRSIVLSPAWSPDNKFIAYSVIAKNRKNVKNTNLYEYNLSANKVKLLSNKLGINSGAHYSPDGKDIALTMSFLGNADIFTLNRETKSVTRLTKTESVDVDPNFSPDGKYISFVSDRSGSSMIYRMNSDGTQTQRLTFAGKYNATPAWSPKNNKLAFASWIDGVFDIFLMNPDGTTLERLTKNQGLNEDPAFSSDGQWLVFSSNRSGQKNIYVMNLMGQSIKRLTFGLGNCTSPRWSNAEIPSKEAQSPKSQ